MRRRHVERKPLEGGDQAATVREYLRDVIVGDRGSGGAIWNQADEPADAFRARPTGTTVGRAKLPA